MAAVRLVDRVDLRRQHDAVLGDPGAIRHDRLARERDGEEIFLAREFRVVLLRERGSRDGKYQGRRKKQRAHDYLNSTGAVVVLLSTPAASVACTCSSHFAA